MTPAAKPSVREDWHRLVGAVVEIRLHGELVRVGKVEQATADSSILWIESDAREPRTLFDKTLGYRVSVHYPFGLIAT